MKKKICSFAILLTALAFSCQVVSAQIKYTVVTPDKIQWGDAPPGLPNGAKLAVLVGNPMGPGMFAIRLKLPAGYVLPPHWHPTDELITIISGTFNMGMGDKFDKKGLKALHAGAFNALPAKMHHYAEASEETIVQVQAMGPFEIHYINPADDPRNKK
jgi:quercetin dioxygenase-like cupin family protein